ncbi:Na+/H+ antiporter NhaC family protein [Thermacetogenium phaeum]|nr:Na+/H+ antiporter NhaC family protein [Thermacetogenium phaeum]
MKRRILLMSVFFTFLFLLTTAACAFAAESDPAAANAQRYGFWTLLPPLLAIVLAFITKETVPSLFLGVFSGTFLLELNGFNVFEALFKGFLLFVDKVLYALADPWNAGIVLQCLAIGGVIALVQRMGGARAVAEALARRAKGPRSAQIVTWLMGIFIFFDDYANSLIVGPVMRPVTDRLRISREKLSFIIDSTAAPIAGIALISTWIGYEISLIKDAYASVGQAVNSYAIFCASIPYRFYNILILAFILFMALFLRDFGPMLKAERRARETGKVLDDNAKPMVSTEATGLEPRPGQKTSIWDAIIPIGVLIFGSLFGFYFNGHGAIMGGEDEQLIHLIQTAPLSFTAIRECFGAADASVVLFQAAIFAGIVAMAIGVGKKIFTLGEAIETWVTGVKSLVITGVILLLAWSLGGVIKELGTAIYLTRILSDAIPPFTLPALIFVLGSLISFATGTSYGTMGILMPLVVPLAYAINPESGYVIMCVGAVLTGAIFGDHCSPISDTTILSSMGAACDHIAHVNTQMWYALVVGVLTLVFGYLPVGLGIPVAIVLPVSIILTGLTVYFLGQPVESKVPAEVLEGRLETAAQKEE